MATPATIMTARCDQKGRARYVAGEAAAGMIPGAVNIPVNQLPDRLGELDPTKPTVVYCAGGYRSSVAASMLRQHGYTDVSDILGGYKAWEQATQIA